VPLKPGPGQDVVDANCGACHSLDYIRTNAPFMTGKVWDAEVTKMIKVFGAPIEPADAKTIIEYLSTAYGTPG
jgi:sulfite dehydrogenase (cytochrome) subunit B